MSNLLNTFFTYEQELGSEDLGQAVKALSEIKRLIRKTESKLLLNSVIMKTASKFEHTPNIKKYQYLEFFKWLEPYFDLIQNKKEILDVTSKILTSNDYISRIISSQIIVLMKDYIEDRVDIFHNVQSPEKNNAQLINVAIESKILLELNYIFKGFIKLINASESFSFTLLQQKQFKNIHLAFKNSREEKKLGGLFQRAATKIQKAEYIKILLVTLKDQLDQEFQEIQSGKNNFSLIYTSILISGSLLISCFVGLEEIIQLLFRILDFLISNCQINQKESYQSCHLIINIFRKLFHLLPNLRGMLNDDLTTILTSVTSGNKFESPYNHKVLAEIIAIIDSQESKDYLLGFFHQLPNEIQLDCLLKNGNILLFESKKIRELITRNIDEISTSYRNSLVLLDIIETLSNKDINSLYETLISKISVSESQQRLKYLNLYLLCVLSLQSRENLSNDFIEPIFFNFLNLRASLRDETIMKQYFSILLEFTKIPGADSKKIEINIIQALEVKEFPDSDLYWMLRKSIPNNCFEISNYICQHFLSQQLDSKFRSWIQVLQIISGSNNFQTFQLMKTLSQMKLLISEKTFTFEYLKILLFISITCKKALKIDNANDIDLHSVKDKFYELLTKYIITFYLNPQLKFIKRVLCSRLIFQDLIENIHLHFSICSTHDNTIKILHSITKKIEKWVGKSKFQDGAWKLYNNLKSAISQTETEYDANEMRRKWLESFTKLEVMIIPRIFFRIPKKLDLTFKIINQEDNLDKKSGELSAKSNLSYIMDLKAEVKNFPKSQQQSFRMTLQARTFFHHNFGCSDDTTNLVSNLTNSYEITHKSHSKDASFLINFPHIGNQKFSTEVLATLWTKKWKILVTKTEKYIINAY